MTELGNLRERHTAIEVLREQNRALERRAAAADELRESVVRLEAEVQAALPSARRGTSLILLLVLNSLTWT